MLTVQDMVNLLQLISSDRLTIRGSEAQGVAELQRKLAAVIEAAKQPPKEDNGDSSNSPE